MMGTRVVIVRSSVARGAALAQVLRRAGWSCVPDSSESPSRDSINAVLVDPEALGESIDDACARATLDWPSMPIVIVGAPTVEAAVKAMRAGAADYLDHAAPPDEFAAALERIRLERSIQGWKAKAASEPDRYPELWGESLAMHDLRDRI